MRHRWAGWSPSPGDRFPVGRRPRGRPAPLRLLLVLGVLIAGLVGMHQLSTGDDCCTGAAAAPTHGQPSGGSQAVALSSAPAPAHTPPSSSAVAPTRAALGVPATGGAPGTAVDTLGACLALLLTGGLLVGALRRWARPVRPTRSLRPVAARFTAPSRGPPLPRRLAHLQVLRL